MSLIIVAGPAGAGKTTFASALGDIASGGVFSVSSDVYLDMPREKRPAALCEDCDQGRADCIVEGCEALRNVIKGGLIDEIACVYWIECHQPKPECLGLTTQQERYLNQLRKERPDVPIYRVTNY